MFKLGLLVVFVVVVAGVVSVPSKKFEQNRADDDISNGNAEMLMKKLQNMIEAYQKEDRGKEQYGGHERPIENRQEGGGGPVKNRQEDGGGPIKNRQQKDGGHDRLTENHKETNQVTAYLKRYGYLDENEDEMKRNGETDKQEERKALKRFQEMFNLPQTGVADAITLDLMAKPRCGNPDIIHKDLDKRFTRMGGIWDHFNLTYKIHNFTPDMTHEAVERAIARALKMWSDVSQLTFTRIDTSDQTVDSANINYHFAPYAHALAYASGPSVGYVNFDEGQNWDEDFLASVATHESGHALGLLHSKYFFSIMWPYYSGHLKGTVLFQDDIRGIQWMYGCNKDTGCLHEVDTSACTPFTKVVDNSEGVATNCESVWSYPNRNGNPASCMAEGCWNKKHKCNAFNYLDGACYFKMCDNVTDLQLTQQYGGFDVYALIVKEECPSFTKVIDISEGLSSNCEARETVTQLVFSDDGVEQCIKAACYSELPIDVINYRPRARSPTVGQCYFKQCNGAGSDAHLQLQDTWGGWNVYEVTNTGGQCAWQLARNETEGVAAACQSSHGMQSTTLNDCKQYACAHGYNVFNFKGTGCYLKKCDKELMLTDTNGPWDIYQLNDGSNN